MEQSGQPQKTKEPWNTKWPDFTLVLETGEELKCHKMMLARSSPFFEAMLSTDCEETRTNRMIVKEIGLETVMAFLEYIYAEQEWMAKQDEDVYTFKFDKAKMTPELMKLAHMYDVKSLHHQCVDYLWQNICDDNAVGIWIEAERCKDSDLIKCVLKYIASKSGEIPNLPRMKEAFKSPKLMEHLSVFLAVDLGIIEAALMFLEEKGEIASNPGMMEAFQSPKLMEKLSVFLATRVQKIVIGEGKKITVVVWSLQSGSKYQVRTRTTDTIKMLTEATHKRLLFRNPQEAETQYFTLNNVKLREDRTLASYGIDDGTLLEYTYKGPK